MTTNQFEQLAGIIETLQAAVKQLEGRPGMELTRAALSQAESLYWDAAEAERLNGIAA